MDLHLGIYGFWCLGYVEKIVGLGLWIGVQWGFSCEWLWSRLIFVEGSGGGAAMDEGRRWLGERDGEF